MRSVWSAATVEVIESVCVMRVSEDPFGWKVRSVECDSAALPPRALDPGIVSVAQAATSREVNQFLSVWHVVEPRGRE